MSLNDDFIALQSHLSQQIIGQETLVNRLLVALLADGHLLVEGAPGLAKTRAIQALAGGIEGDFQRIQFTPDLLPSDITGSDIFRPEDSSFKFQPGPIFHNLILADEINRAPAKVQSALLEAMAERQVSIGSNTYPLPDLFLVMATQNPIEQEGTYPLPEAQLDRFLLHVPVVYPSAEAEKAILQLVRGEAMQGDDTPPPVPLSQTSLQQARQAVLDLHMADAVEDYLVQLVIATRQLDRYGEDLGNLLEYGASPRATLALDRCARALAWLNHKDYVSPADIQAIFPDVIRHRVILSFEAEAQGMTKDGVINEIINRVPAP